MTKKPDPDRVAARAELALDVAEMRSLGVARWGEIVLDPRGPQTEPQNLSTEEKMRREEDAREKKALRNHETLFAASNFRPKFQRAPAPDSVVQRSRPREHDDGPANGTKG